MKKGLCTCRIYFLFFFSPARELSSSVSDMNQDMSLTHAPLFFLFFRSTPFSSKNVLFLVSCFVFTTCSWEQWVLRVVVNNTPRPISNDSAAVIERQRVQDTAEGMLRTVLLKVFDVAGESLDHIPPVMYEFEITSTRQADDRENMYSRVATMPPIFHLAN